MDNSRKNSALEGRCFLFINNSRRGSQSSFEDVLKWGTAREPWYQQPGDRSYGTPKP